MKSKIENSTRERGDFVVCVYGCVSVREWASEYKKWWQVLIVFFCCFLFCFFDQMYKLNSEMKYIKAESCGVFISLVWVIKR